MRSLRAVIAALAICAIGTVIVLTHVSESPADRIRRHASVLICFCKQGNGGSVGLQQLWLAGDEVHSQACCILRNFLHPCWHSRVTVSTAAGFGTRDCRTSWSNATNPEQI
jgi:hypothetical protein